MSSNDESSQRKSLVRNTGEDAAGGGEASDADAPTAVEEDESMSTILSPTPVTGVQRDAGDE